MLILLVMSMRWLQPTLLKSQHMIVGGAPSPKRDDNSGNVAKEGPGGRTSSTVTPKGKSIRQTVLTLSWEAWLITLNVVAVTIHTTVFSAGCERYPPRRRRKSPGWWTHIWRLMEVTASRTGDWILANVETNRSKRRRARMFLTVGRVRQTTRIVAMTALAMQASATISTEREVTFDTDSEIVGIDNRCTACISHSLDDFEGTLVPSNRVVKGFGGSRTRNVKSGTIRWSGRTTRVK